MGAFLVFIGLMYWVRVCCSVFNHFDARFEELEKQIKKRVKPDAR